MTSEWLRLQAAQLDLRGALAEGPIGAERDELIHQFRTNRAAIRRLDSEMADRTVPDTSVADAIPETDGSDDPPADHQVQSAEADDEVDELLEMLVYQHERADSPPSPAPALSPALALASNDESSTGGKRSQRLLTASVMLGLAGIAVVSLSLLVGANPADQTDSGRSSTSIAQSADIDIDIDITPSANGDGDGQALEELDSPDVKADAKADVTPQPALRIGLVGPGAADDGSFTQSMVDGLAVVAAERGGMEIEIVENVSTRSAAAAIRGFAEDDVDLVIAHSSAFMSALMPVAEEYPQVTFAIGTVREASELPNVYTYAIAAEEGGYVLGALAARLSESNVVGAVGPVEVGTSRRYIDGFRAGAEAEREDVTVLVTYTGSFSDGEAAATAARQQISAGGDLLTGQGHVMGPAIAAAETSGARWIGNQVSQASVAPGTVVASQVYRWDVGLRAIIADIDSGKNDGQESVWVGDMANGGIVLDFSPDLDIDEATQRRLDELVTAITAGSIDPLP